ncbi:MAG: hypothetical protein ACTHQQ_20190 [Solirubrobacteraceae bacterium]
MADAVDFAVKTGVAVERRAVDRLLNSGEPERILRRLIDGLFDSGLFDQFIEGVAKSDALWQLIDEIATHPVVAERVAGRLRHRWHKDVPSKEDVHT